MMHGQEVQVGNKVGTICGIEFVTKRIWVQYEDGRRELHDQRDVTFREHVDGCLMNSITRNTDECICPDLNRY